MAKLQIIVGILIFFLVQIPSAFTTSITVTSTADSGPGTLRQAVLDADPGDTIRFNASSNGDTIKLDSQIEIDSLVIIGNDTSNTILDGQGFTRIFYVVGKSTLIGIRFQNALGFFGGAILNENLSELIVERCLFIDNISNQYGGAIMSKGRLEIYQCGFLYNTAIPGSGGAIYHEISSDSLVIDSSFYINNGAYNGAAIKSWGPVKISNSLIDSNIANNDGGGIDLSAPIDAYNVFIRHNNANSSGGGIYTTSNISCKKCTIEYNSSNSGGGIMGWNMEYFHLDSSVINYNNTLNSGGGINISSDTILIKNSELSYNEAEISNGGGMYIASSNGITHIEHTTIIDNIADDDGGGICKIGNNDLEIHYSTISGNIAEKGSGGAIYFPIGANGDLYLNHSLMVGNTASEYGGGVRNLDDVIINNSEILGNKARIGGGFYVSRFAMYNSRMSGNFASEDGGGVRSYYSVIAKNSVFSGNEAGNNGGAIITIAPSTSKLFNSTLTGNKTGKQGGAAFHFGTLQLVNSIVTKNSDSGSYPELYSVGNTIIDLGYNLIGDTTGLANKFPNSTLKGGPGNIMDPLFKEDVPPHDSLGGDLRLQCTSPALDAGNPDTTGLGLGPVDIGNFPRITLRKIDIGAWEFQTADLDPVNLVTNTNNDGCGSLRFAVDFSDEGDTIRFDSSIDTDSITLDSQIVIDKNLVILGNGPTKTIIDGQDTSRIFQILENDSVIFKDLCLQRANVEDYGYLENGGAAILNSGFITLKNAELKLNKALYGAVILMDTASYAYLEEVKLYKNYSIDGNIFTQLNSIVELNQIEMFSNNAIGIGGAILNAGGTVSILSSKIRGNTAGYRAGGIFSSGILILENSQISGNKAVSEYAEGGGLFIRDSAIILNSTISGNYSGSHGGGLYNDLSADLRMKNTIWAKNIANVYSPDIYNRAYNIYDEGFNIIGDTTGAENDFPNTTLKGGPANIFDPNFMQDVPLDDSLGGDLRLYCGSPAIEAGDSTGNTITHDLDGGPRIFGTTIDIGAYERGSSPGEVFVTTLSDDGFGSLRDAIRLACKWDTIRFLTSLNGDTIKLDSQIVIDKNLVILGNDTTNTIISGQHKTRIFNIATGDTVHLIGLNLQNGKVSGPGGAIANYGEVHILNSVLANHSVTLPSLFIYGGALYNEAGKAFIENSTFRNNTAINSNGGAVYNNGGNLTIKSSVFKRDSAAVGGAIYCFGGQLNLSFSTLKYNWSSIGGGIQLASGAIAFIDNTNISENLAESYGGAINVDQFSTAHIRNSLLNDNETYEMGGALASTENTSIHLINSTISGNSSDIGGGIFNFDQIHIVNTIVALNTDFGSSPDIFNIGSITDGGFNIIGDTTGVEGIFTVSTMKGGTGAVFDPLFVTGGYDLQCISPAIDAGKPDTTGLNLGDQDVAGNPRIASIQIDIGAYEKPEICEDIEVVHNGTIVPDGDMVPAVQKGTLFGETCTSESDTFYIKNTALQIVVIDSIYFSPVGSSPGEFEYNHKDYTFPDTIYPNDSIMLTVDFSPTSGGEDSTVLLIDNNDPDENPYDFLLIGIRDTTKPVVYCKDTVIYVDQNSIVNLTAAMLDSTSTDNCGIQSIQLSQTEFDCSDGGENESYLTVRDNSGNESICTTTVTVIRNDISSPSISGPDEICQDISNIKYAITEDPLVTNCVWSYSGTDVTIKGNGNNEIMLDFGASATSGMLSVELTTICGPSGIVTEYAVNMGSTSFCELASCLQDSMFVDDEMISVLGALEVFEVEELLESNATIPNGKNITFRSGNQTILRPLFSLEKGALLKIESQSCAALLKALKRKEEF